MPCDVDEGQSTAFKWYSAGCRTLDDLRNQKGDVHLNSVQLIGLQHYEGFDQHPSYMSTADHSME
jgi:hypothetical protein